MLRIASILIAGLMTLGTASAQTVEAWPSKPIRFIVPFPSGGSTDAVARLVGHLLSARLGQPFVIENHSGASGNIGTAALARAAPDGYTIGLATTTTLALAPSFTRNLPFDPIRDFAPVSLLGSSPFVMVVSPSLPATNLSEFIALAKSKPDGLSYGSAGTGSLAHLAGALFANQADIKIVHVPYRASPPSVTDMMTGRLDMQFTTIPPTLALLRAGKLRAFGIASARRSALLPDVPTIAEAGLAGYEASLWMALVTPAGTPSAIVDRVNREITAALDSAEGKDAMSKQGVDAETSTPVALAERIRDDTGKWRELIDKTNIRPE